MSNMLYDDLIRDYYDEITAAQRRFLRELVSTLQPKTRSEEDELIMELSLECNIREYLPAAGLVEPTEKLLSKISQRRKAAAGVD